jgi:DNA gyrase subunit B
MAEKSNKSEGKYKAEQIKVLEGLEGVRRRPAMYIGGTGKDGLHHCVYEVVDNSIDEALAGHADSVEITINKDGSLTVKDNGRGIPVDMHPVYKKPALEIALTKLHAGGKFEKSAYEISGGLHGVGVSCVNALSIKLIATVCKDGKKYQQEYKIGKPVANMKTIGKCDKGEQGTTIQFWPDKEIFSTVDFDFAYLKKRLQELAFLNPIAKIILKDEKLGKKEIFHYEGGLMEFVKHINKAKTILHKPIYFKREDGGNVIEVAIQYTDSYNESIFGFVNTINTTEGGTHISGFKTALTRAINDYANKKGLLKNVKIEGNDVREGITSIISLKMRDPQFEGQTKTKLGNSDMKGTVDSMVYLALGEFLEENPAVSNKITQKAIASSKARTAAKKARDLVRRKSAIGGLSGLPGKLSDCSSRKTERTEMYIVEGDSAAGSSKMARDKEFQAILPLKGKILNVEKSNPTRALSSDEIVNLITAIGTQVKENFNIEKLRYNKIIIMTDADVDGSHIRTLLLTFFFRYMPELIENGNVYVAVSPLYRVRKKKDYYVYSDDELKKLVAKLGGTPDVQRFKGLGEMNPGQLWDTTMNPKTRILKKINIEDAVLADETFSMLMGDVVAPRRRFIEANANIAEVDI